MVQLKSVAAAVSAGAATALAGKSKVVDLPIWTADGYYSVNFTVGTPPKSFRLEFDTGSSTTWLINDACTTQNCPNYSGYPRDVYNIDQSSTGAFTGGYVENDYTGGNIQGPIVQDLFHLKGLAPWNLTFVDSTTDSFFSNTNDGFVGLAFPDIAATGTQPMLIAMGEQGVIDEPKFGIYYGDVNLNSTNQGGILTLGGTREKDYVKGDIVEVPIVKTNYEGVEYEVWKANFTRMRGSGSKKYIEMPNSLVTFDSGTGPIIVSTNYIDALYESLGLGWNYTLILQDKQALYCSEFNSSWSVTFAFGPKGDREVTLYGDELAQPGFPIAPGACFPPFQDAGGDYNIFGADMFNRLYSTWDMGSFNPSKFAPSVRFGRLDHRPISGPK